MKHDIDKQQEWLDFEHNDLIERILDRDTKAARAELARLFGSELTDDIAALRDEQRHLGSEEQLRAIEATGWMPWAPYFLVAAWVIAILDAFLWAVGAARVLAIN